ncbi:hypothetical protein B0H13DRAFT_1623077 [Mycena leptocephala]|nr:hypothetical protein B0H13DRAFT_1623077 [Mycena leptocephala]
MASRLLLLLLILPSTLARQDVFNLVLDAPEHPPAGQQVVDANYQSYSIEFSYMQDYAGNNTNPNKFSAQLLQNLQDISGAYPMIRAGGSTQNRAVFVPNQTEAVILRFSHPTDDQPAGLTIGPAWMQAFQQFPEGTRYIYGLTFYDFNDTLIGGRNGIDETVAEAELAYGAIKDDLFAFEIGNEVDGWTCTSRRPCNWTVETYVAQWQEYAAAIQEHLNTSAPLIQGCVFEAPSHIGFNATPFWNVENAVRFGMNASVAKTLADHDYMGSICEGAQPPSLQASLLNHTHTAAKLYNHAYLSNATAGTNMAYVLGETNSISCQGAAGVSDVFAAALWGVDYVLYTATLKVARLYYHMGTPYRYSAWQPINWPNTNTTRGVKPLYYGNLFTARVFSGGGKQISVLVNETTTTVYGVYNARSSSLEAVVVVNLEGWNSTQPAAERPSISVRVPEHLAHGEVRRLTAPGVEIAEGITFMGQYVDDEGIIRGDEVVETVVDGVVQVGAGEAVLVSL